MNQYLNELCKLKQEKMKKAYQKHGMEITFVENKEELCKALKPLLVNGKSISFGGSQTLFETGVIDLVRSSDVTLYDRYKEGLSGEEIQDIFRKAFTSDLYVTSTNAMTIDGYLYNIDYTGNRVAAMIYGPKEVIVVVGKNKIFESEASAIEHVRNVACPANCMRLNRQTPCVKTCKCMDCESEDRLCSAYTKMGKQRVKGRIKIFIVNEDYGY